LKTRKLLIVQWAKKGQIGKMGMFLAQIGTDSGRNSRIQTDAKVPNWRQLCHVRLTAPVYAMDVSGSLYTLEVARHPNRRYKVGTVASLEGVPAILESCSPHFMLLLAMDASSLKDEEISASARILLSRGLAGFSVWGPDCSRVHDLFDLERDPGETDETVVVTTWHADEPITEAVCYFDLCAYPAAGFERDCSDWVAIAVGNESWEEEISTAVVKGFDGEL
jgi:hypothetical protein